MSHEIVKSGKGIANMNTLLMESNEIFRTTSPREMTCELFGKKSETPLQKSREGLANAARGTNTEEEQNILLGCWNNHFQGNHAP